MLVNDKEKKIKKRIQEITKVETDINQNVCYDLIKDYRTFVIKKILLLSSSFDYFLLEEEGRLNFLFKEWCSFSEYETSPTITHVENSKEALNKIRKENYDLIIIFNPPKDISLKELTKKIKDEADFPIVLLDNDISELLKISNENDIKIDKFFTWNGDGKIMLSIIQYFEDKKNLENLSETEYKSCILLIEDSIQHYSTYLSLINEEICNYLKKINNENLNCEQRTLRYKRRPYVLHTEDYEKGIKFYEKYKNDLILIITDNYIEKEGIRKKIGINLANKVSEEKRDLQILIQSSEPIDKKEIKNKNIIFISKSSHSLISKLRKFIKKNLGPFPLIINDRKENNKYEIKKINYFNKIINKVGETALLNCAKNKDISKWLRSIGEIEIADRCSVIEDTASDGEILKKQLITIIEDYNYQINQASINTFSPRMEDPYVKITRIGDGALGGKARGLAFLAKLVSKYLTKDMFPNLKITIPRSIVLTTEIFDNFMYHNNLNDIDFYHLSDERISSKFLKASLPATVLGDLRSFVKKTRKPLIVRSSGLLEDSLMQPFAGIYASMVLPNESFETDLRFQEVCNAIKHVYASTYFEEARTYLKSTPKHIGDEKMAILIQELIGEKHENVFYPTISGVAKSYNYYPQGPCKPEEGIVYLALGLGKSIVDGGSSFAFCPSKPKAPLFGTPKDYMKYAQTNFYTLNLSSIYKYVNYSEETSLDKFDIDMAKKHNVLDKVVSTYIVEDDSLYPGIYDGNLVVDFGPIIQYEEIPLAKALNLLLKISEIALGYPVEIEFAVNIPNDKNKKSELVILQIRNMISPEKSIDIDIDKIYEEDILLKSKNILGHGIIKDIFDIIYIDQNHFDLSNSNEVVNKIREINNSLLEKNTPYILIGPGRWGSSDPWLGIPVIWSYISGAKAIVETPYKERPIDPSQGSHFFHDMIAAQVVYLITKNKKDIDWNWIKKQKVIQETNFIKHIKTKKSLEIIVDGKKAKGAILKDKIKNQDELK